MTYEGRVTRELLICYFLGEFLVLNCQMYVSLLKSILTNCTVSMEKPKFCSLGHFLGETTDLRLGSEFCEPQKTVIRNYDIPVYDMIYYTRV